MKRAFRKSVLHISAAVLALTLVAALPVRADVIAVTNSVFDPDDFETLGTLKFSSGSLTCNTETLTMSGLFNGTGVVARSQGENVHLAGFKFDRIQLGSNVNVTITGTRGLLLLSAHSIGLDTAFDVSGKKNRGDLGGYGGPGGEGGIPPVSLNQTSVKTGHSRDLTRKLNAPGERILWGR